MAEFICPDQINRDYFTVDDNGLIIPKVYPTFTQVPENVVPTPYASLALATADATASPVTIIAEVVNAGDPCENGVYAIEPNGDTKKLENTQEPFFVPVPIALQWTSAPIGVYTQSAPYIDFTYTNTSSCKQLIEFDNWGTVYSFIEPSAGQIEVKYDHYVKMQTSLPDENGETLFSIGLGQQHVAPASAGGNIEQTFANTFRKILNPGDVINFKLFSEVGNFSGLRTANSIIGGIPGVTHRSFIVTPL